MNSVFLIMLQIFLIIFLYNIKKIRLFFEKRVSTLSTFKISEQYFEKHFKQNKQEFNVSLELQV